KNDADKILDDGLQLAQARLTNENRVRYLLACIAIALVINTAVGAAISRGLVAPSGPPWLPFAIAMAAGAAGAVFSIAIGVQNLDLQPCTESVMNYLVGGLRVLTGALGGPIVLLIATRTIIGDALVKLFHVEAGADALLKTTGVVVLLAFLAGFAERLVPSLLGTITKDGPQT
ncbi:MAG TPA: hypothetical protein VHS58_20880, partial [Acetobacteraceae bacterium]|nr:hypothetical protein [Acetobacteraceae bacterium]